MTALVGLGKKKLTRAASGPLGTRGLLAGQTGDDGTCCRRKRVYSELLLSFGSDRVVGPGEKTESERDSWDERMTPVLV